MLCCCKVSDKGIKQAIIFATIWRTTSASWSAVAGVCALPTRTVGGGGLQPRRSALMQSRGTRGGWSPIGWWQWCSGCRGTLSASVLVTTTCFVNRPSPPYCLFLPSLFVLPFHCNSLFIIAAVFTLYRCSSFCLSHSSCSVHVCAHFKSRTLLIKWTHDIHFSCADKPAVRNVAQFLLSVGHTFPPILFI